MPDLWTMSDPWSASRHVVAATCIKHHEGFGLEPHFVPKLSLAAVMLLMLVQGAAGTEVALAASSGTTTGLIEHEASSGLTCLLVVQLVVSHFSMIAFACLCVRLRRCRSDIGTQAAEHLKSTKNPPSSATKETAETKFTLPEKMYVTPHGKCVHCDRGCHTLVGCRVVESKRWCSICGPPYLVSKF